MIGFSELLRGGNIPEKDEREYLDSIVYSGNALLQLVNDVLDFSKLEADQMTIQPEPTDFRELGDEVMKVFQYRAQEQKIKLVMDVPALPMMELDKLRIRQILFNLIGNAVKFTPSGSVTLHAEFMPNTDGTMCFTFSVIDTGIGIAETDRAKLMEPFVQLSKMRGTNSGNSGTGLGLSISKRMIEKMDGKLWMESEVGKGSTFGATLYHVLISKLDGKEGEEHDDRKLGTPPAKVTTVMLVDDVAMNRSVMKALCQKAGFVRIATASSGAEALAELGKEPTDLVLTDLWMPGMNGAQLAAKLRQDKRLASIPILAVTADAEAKDNFSMTNFNGVLLKPVTLDKILRLKGLSPQGFTHLRI